MGFFSDLFTSITSSGDAWAEGPSEAKPQAPQEANARAIDTSGKEEKSIGPHQGGGGGVAGGASAQGTPATGTDEESAEEAEINKQDSVKKTERGGTTQGDVAPGEDKGEPPAGDEGKVARGKEELDRDEEEAGAEEEAEEEEEEDEDEPQDPMPKLQDRKSQSTVHNEQNRSDIQIEPSVFRHPLRLSLNGKLTLLSRTECAHSKECAPLKHHYDDCVERVTAMEEGKYNGPKEDCVEECKANTFYEVFR